MRRGFTLTDLVAGVAVTGVLGALAVTVALAEPSGNTERLFQSLANLRAIGEATGAYRADNRGYLPLETTTSRRRPNILQSDVSGWCTWQYGGKNSSASWYQSYGGSFDVEAADRPLNPYLYPGYTFIAPTPPARLPANDPARTSQEARVFRDPADVNGHQRSWPNPNNPVTSSYNDVGTSYLAQMAWWEQISRQFGGLSFTQQYNLGTARLASDQGVDPSRFVHVLDDVGDIVSVYTDPNLHMTGNYGGINQGVSLFADGHAGLVTFRPGGTRATSVRPEYSVWFEDLPRPGAEQLGGAGAVMK